MFHDSLSHIFLHLTFNALVFQFARVLFTGMLTVQERHSLVVGVVVSVAVVPFRCVAVVAVRAGPSEPGVQHVTSGVTRHLHHHTTVRLSVQTALLRVVYGCHCERSGRCRGVRGLSFRSHGGIAVAVATSAVRERLEHFHFRNEGRTSGWGLRLAMKW